VAWALVAYLDESLAEIDVVPGEREGLRDAGAGADEQLGQRSVVRGAGVEVWVDLAQAQVVELAPLDGKRRDELARVAGE
jgi:hypothetical protein